MPTFHFNALGGAQGRSSASVELRDLGAARVMEMRFASDMLKEVNTEISSYDLTVEVTNDQDLVLFVIIIHAMNPTVRR